ncbi:amidohydrolase family protein [Steroidobacter sp.]|uniref:amidohydrolase family protein n=1 Tax=Steroidobacter sp. TaxID=1978227 RepID=UPI001A5F19B2|nr:amidohydrolase family protein [Steroidobacter sp.]MBL8268826.1 amidohydrolase family protein [Steroidobacter sp.]
MGKPAGTQTSLVKPDGEREFSFEYSLRGYGPKLLSRVRTDAFGLPVSIETSGSNYLKMPVQERFSIADGTARWKNGEQVGERRESNRYYYLSAQAVPEDLALLANALLKTPEGRLALLPEGQASIRRTGEAQLHNGTATRSVISYEVTGLDFAPSTVWLDTDRTFFASTSGWLAVVRSGWESSLPELASRQELQEAQRSRELARQLIRQPSGPLAIINANLFDAHTGRSTPGTTILLAGNRIQAIGPDGALVIPPNAQRIDAAGRAAVPGLWDMHTHIAARDGVLHMAAGVTSVRDLGNDSDSLLATKKQIDAGELIGPRIVMAGFIDGRGPYVGPTKVFADTPVEAQAAVERYAQLGYDGIKIYSSIKPELVPTIIQLAHAKGMRVGGHVPAFMNARQFIEAGADELQHINFVFLNFFFDSVKDTRTPVRFTAVAERAAMLDLNSEPVRSFVRLLRERHTVVDPTANVYEAAFTDRPGAVPRRYAAVADQLPPQVRRGLLEGGFPVPAGKDQRYRDSSQALLRMIKLLYDSGVTVVAGSDALAGFALHRELELYVEAGIPAREVLRIATIGAARVAKRDDELGSIAPGKLADLLLVDGDPAQRIGDLRRTWLVIKNGSMLQPEQLYRSVGVGTDAASAIDIEQRQ